MAAGRVTSAPGSLGLPGEPIDRGLHYEVGPACDFASKVRSIRRRAEAVGRRVVVAGSPSTPDGWRELALRLGAAECKEPHAAAEALRLEAGNLVLVVVEGEVTEWGREVARELEGHPGGGMLLFVLTEE